MNVPPLIDKIQGASLVAPSGGGVRPITITFVDRKTVKVHDVTNDALQLASILMIKVPSATLREVMRILDFYVRHDYPDLTQRIPESPFSLRQLDLFLDRE